MSCFNIYVLHMPGIWSVLVAWPAREPIYDLPRRDIEILASAKMLTGYQNYGMHKCCINIIINIHSINIKKYIEISSNMIWHWYAGNRPRSWSFTGQERQQATKWSLAELEDPVSTCSTEGHMSLQTSAVSPLRLTTFYQHTQGEWYV